MSGALGEADRLWVVDLLRLLARNLPHTLHVDQDT